MADYIIPSGAAGGNTAGAINWKSSVADYASLPGSGNSSGDARITLDTSDIWIWNGSAWVSSTAGAIALTNAHILVGNASNVATDVAMSGDATIANTGAVTIANNAITNTKVSASAAIDFSKLAALASARLIVGSAGNVPTAVDVTGDVTISNAGVTTIGASKVTEAMQVLADNTTNDVSTTKHGYAPKAPNDATKYLDGTGNYSVPAGSGGSLPAPQATSMGATPLMLDNTLQTVFGTGITVAETGIYMVTLRYYEDFAGVVTHATNAPTSGFILTQNGSNISGTNVSSTAMAANYTVAGITGRGGCVVWENISLAAGDVLNVKASIIYANQSGNWQLAGNTVVLEAQQTS